MHHDLWDFDTNSAPTLIDITKDGKTIPALVQTSKQGFLYVLDRTTGEPLSIRSKSARCRSRLCRANNRRRRSRMSAVPKPVVDEEWPGVFWLADIVELRLLHAQGERAAAYEGRFTPPSLKGSLIYPATIGGVEWGGGAVDPNKQIFVVNSTSAVQIYKLAAAQGVTTRSRRSVAEKRAGFFR